MVLEASYGGGVPRVFVTVLSSTCAGCNDYRVVSMIAALGRVVNGPIGGHEVPVPSLGEGSTKANVAKRMSRGYL
jgi:hypothetical protein